MHCFREFFLVAPLVSPLVAPLTTTEGSVAEFYLDSILPPLIKHQDRQLPRPLKKSSAVDIARMMRDKKMLSSNAVNKYDDDDESSQGDGVISGRVYKDKNDEGVKDIPVYLIDITTKEHNREICTITDSGKYVFDGIRPSTYVVGIAKMKSTGSLLYDEESHKSNDLATQKIIEVRNGDDPLGVDFGYHRLDEDVYSTLIFAADQDKIKAFIAYITYISTIDHKLYE